MNVEGAVMKNVVTRIVLLMNVETQLQCQGVMMMNVVTIIVMNVKKRLHQTQ